MWETRSSTIGIRAEGTGIGAEAEGVETVGDAWGDLNDNWGKAVERNMDREVEVDRASEQVDVGRLNQDGRAGGWQPEPSMGGSGNSCSTELT